MKKYVYIPSSQELNEMQEILNCGNISTSNKMFKYSKAKLIEYIIANGGLKYFDQYITNDYSIAQGVIKYIPENILRTKFNDLDELILPLINNNKEKIVSFGLDNLKYVSSDMLSSSMFVTEVIKLLSDTIKKYPEYRFVYEKNELLDAIFSKNLFEIISNRMTNKPDFYQMLLQLDPAYILDLDYETVFLDKAEDNIFSENSDLIKLRSGNALDRAIDEYTARFGVLFADSKYLYENDITNTKDDYYKKLIHRLDEYQKRSIR